MKVAIFIATLFVITSTSAFAHGESGRAGGINLNLRSTSQATANAEARSNSVSEGGNAVAHGGSGGIGMGGAGGNANAVGNGGYATNGGNTQIINEAAVPANTKHTIRNTPDPTAPSFTATADCLGAASGGLTLVGFGLTAGKSYEALECQRGEWFRLLNTYGERQAALEVACQSPIVAKTFMCRGSK